MFGSRRYQGPGSHSVLQEARAPYAHRRLNGVRHLCGLEVALSKLHAQGGPAVHTCSLAAIDKTASDFLSPSRGKSKKRRT